MECRLKDGPNRVMIDQVSGVGIGDTLIDGRKELRFLLADKSNGCFLHDLRGCLAA